MKCPSRLPLENHSENNPLLLMKQSERIAVKEVDNSKQYIHVDPLQSNLEAFKQQVCHLYKYESCELRIDGKVVDAWVDCFKGNCVEVTKKSSPPSGYRGSAPTRYLVKVQLIVHWGISFS